MRGLLLGRSTSLSRYPTLSASQLSLDSAFNTLTEEIRNPLSIVAMVGGGFVFRGSNLVLSRLASPLLAESRALTRVLANTAIRAASLGNEVIAFRSISQGPSHVFEGREFATDYLNFGILKSVAKLAHGTSLPLTHFLQSAGMVAGHNLAYGLGFNTTPEGTWIEQLAHAEATNIKLGLGMSLVGMAAPGLSRMERSLDIQNSSMNFSGAVLRRKLFSSTPLGFSFSANLGSNFELRRQRIAAELKSLNEEIDFRPDDAPPLVSKHEMADKRSKPDATSHP